MGGVFKDGAYFPLGSGEEMSEGEYQYYQGLGDSIFEGEPPHSLNEEHGYWCRKDGQSIEIKKMSAQHLENAIALFTKAGWGSHSKLDELREELRRRSP